MNTALSRLSADVLISSPIRSSWMVFTPFLVSTVLVGAKHVFSFLVVVSGGGVVVGGLVVGGLVVGSD